MTAPEPASDQHPTTRRDLLKPVQLLGLAFVAAVFAGVIALVSMGIFQDLDAAEREHVIVVSLVVAGIAFIATLVGIALLMLAVDPAQVTKQIDAPVLDRDDKTPDAGAPGAQPGTGPRG
jgi:hypothetical protein